METGSEMIMSISQAADYLGISEDTLRRWERMGKIAPGRTVGNVRRYTKTELDKIKEGSSTAGTQQVLNRIDTQLKSIKEILENSNKNVSAPVSGNDIKQVPDTTGSGEHSQTEIPPTRLDTIPLTSTISNKVKHFVSNTILGNSAIAKPSLTGIILLLILCLVLYILFILRQVVRQAWFEGNREQVSDQQVQNIIEPPQPGILQGDGLKIGTDKLTIDSLGNVDLTGSVRGGYLDTAAHNLIVNSGLEQNQNGKALYYQTEGDGAESNVFVSQDTSVEGENALKVVLVQDAVYRIRPSYQTLNSGKTYTFSLSFKSLGVRSATLAMGYGSSTEEIEISDDTEWQHLFFTHTFSQEESPDTDAFFIEIKDVGSGGSIYLDNLQLENGTVATTYKPGTLATDGIFSIQKDTLFPLVSGTGVLGTIAKPFQEFVVNEQTIINDLLVEGNTSIEGELTVSGDMVMENVTAANKVTVQGDGLYTGPGIGTKRLDKQGNLLNISSIGLSYGTLNSTTDFLTSSVGLAVGGAQTYYFNKNGFIKAAQVNTLQDIRIGDPNGETDSLGVYFVGVSGHNNEAGLRFNTSSGKIEYRDDNSSSWTTLDSLTNSGSSADTTASNGLTKVSDDIQLGGSLTKTTTFTLGGYNLVHNLSGTGDISIQDNGTSFATFADNGSFILDSMVLDGETLGHSGNPDLLTLSSTGLTVDGFVSATSATLGSALLSGTLNTAALKVGSSTTEGYVLTADANGYATWQSVTSGTTYTGGNGITLSGGAQFQLGGTLGEATTIALGANDFTYSLDSTGDVHFRTGTTDFATFADNGSFTLDSLVMDGATIGHSSDLDLLTLGTNSLTFNGTGITLGSATNTNVVLASSLTNALSFGNTLMTFDTANNRVGIGVTAPQSMFEVNGGDIRVTGGAFIDDGTTLDVPDYVFEDSYPLMSLSDLDSFITTNKHLPGVPDMNDTRGWSALSLQDRDMKILEKTEENILYLLGHESRLADLESSASIAANSGDLMLESQTYNGLLSDASANSLETLSATVTNSSGKAVVAISGFARVVTARLEAGLVSARAIIADTIVTRQLRVQDRLLSPIVEADQVLTDQLYTQRLAAGDATVSGTLAARTGVFNHVTMQQLNTSGDATIAGQLDVSRINSEVLGADTASISGELYAESARFKTLTAEKVKAESIEGLDARLGSMVAASVSAELMSLRANAVSVAIQPSPSPSFTNEGETEGVASPVLPDDWESSLDALMARLSNIESATASGSWSAPDNLAYDSQILAGAVDTDFAMINTYLGVLGTASIVNAHITNTLTVQDSLTLSDNAIATLSDTLFIQPTGLGKVDILAGAVTVESNGTLRVNGDLYLKGNLYAKGIETGTLHANTATVAGSLFANLLETSGKDLTIDLTGDGQATESARLAIINTGTEVASIDASGSARFKALTASKLYLPYTNDSLGNSIDTSASADELTKNADSIGMGTVKAGQRSVFIQAPSVTKDSLIFLTPTTTTTTPLAVSSKTPGTGFTVSIASPQSQNASFNWWIIN